MANKEGEKGLSLLEGKLLKSWPDSVPTSDENKLKCIANLKVSETDVNWDSTDEDYVDGVLQDLSSKISFDQFSYN
jgi:hypothetical protein